MVSHVFVVQIFCQVDVSDDCVAAVEGKMVGIGQLFRYLGQGVFVAYFRSICLSCQPTMFFHC